MAAMASLQAAARPRPFKSPRPAPAWPLPTAVQTGVIYSVSESEIFPLRPSSMTSAILEWHDDFAVCRVLDGAQAESRLQEQELIEGVENMQIVTASTRCRLDGIINGDTSPQQRR